MPLVRSRSSRGLDAGVEAMYDSPRRDQNMPPDPPFSGKLELPCELSGDDFLASPVLERPSRNGISVSESEMRWQTESGGVSLRMERPNFEGGGLESFLEGSGWNRISSGGVENPDRYRQGNMCKMQNSPPLYPLNCPRMSPLLEIPFSPPRAAVSSSFSPPRAAAAPSRSALLTPAPGLYNDYIRGKMEKSGLLQSSGGIVQNPWSTGQASTLEQSSHLAGTSNSAMVATLPTATHAPDSFNDTTVCRVSPRASPSKTTPNPAVVKGSGPTTVDPSATLQQATLALLETVKLLAEMRSEKPVSVAPVEERRAERTTTRSYLSEDTLSFDRIEGEMRTSTPSSRRFSERPLRDPLVGFPRLPDWCTDYAGSGGYQRSLSRGEVSRGLGKEVLRAGRRIAGRAEEYDYRPVNRTEGYRPRESRFSEHRFDESGDPYKEWGSPHVSPYALHRKSDQNSEVNSFGWFSRPHSSEVKRSLRSRSTSLPVDRPTRATLLRQQQVRQRIRERDRSQGPPFISRKSKSSRGDYNQFSCFPNPELGCRKANNPAVRFSSVPRGQRGGASSGRRLRQPVRPTSYRVGAQPGPRPGSGFYEPAESFVGAVEESCSFLDTLKDEALMKAIRAQL